MKNLLLRLVVAFLFVMSFVSAGCSRPLHRQVHVFSSSRSERTWLGVQLQDVTSRLKERKNLTTSEGAYVDEVVEGSPAERAGIEEGDVIVKFDGTTITDSDDLTSAVHKTPPKSEVKVELLRKGDRKTISVTLGRQRAPEAYSYHFEMPRIPRIPRMPSMPRAPFHVFMSTTEESYGLTLESLTKQLAEYFEVPGKKGILVSEVEEDSRAEKAGFKAGDIITKINSHTIRNVEDFQEELSDSRDSSASFELVRKGKTVTVSMKLERRDDDDDGEDDDYSFNSCPAAHSPVARSDWWSQRHAWITSELNVIQEKIATVEQIVLSKISLLQDEFRRALS